jgi:ribosome-binding protein aMBF1 (putative translation factor)
METTEDTKIDSTSKSDSNSGSGSGSASDNATKDFVIIQFDEDDSYNMVLEMICFNMGLKVSAYARNIDETRNIIKRIEAKTLTPQIAVIANYLGYDFFDGEKLTKKLKELVPDIKVIAYVTDLETTWGDYLAIKSGQEQSKSLVSIIEQLTGKKFIASNLP